MVTGTVNTEEEQTLVEPMENQMWEREGFDRRGIRREFAGTRALQLGDKYVEQEERTIVDPRTINMPVGPTGFGEVGGSGVENMRIDGDRFKTHRWTQGFTQLEEDDTNGQMQRDYIMEMFDFFSDASFLTGLGPDGEYADGMIDWLRNAVPSERTFDLAEYASDGTYSGVEENLIFKDAQETIHQELIDAENGQWDSLVGGHQAITQLNAVSGNSGGGSGVAGDTYWQRLSHENAVGGISGWNRLPRNISPNRLPKDLRDEIDVDEMVVDIVDTDTAVKDSGTDGNGIIGHDEAFLLPSLSNVRESFFNTFEMPSPHYFGPHQLRAGKEAHDYVTRYTHHFNPDDQHQDATDVIHLKNLSQYFTAEESS